MTTTLLSGPITHETLCAGCSMPLGDESGYGATWVGITSAEAKPYHSMQCYESTLSPREILQRRVDRVDRLRSQLALAEREMAEAAKQCVDRSDVF